MQREPGGARGDSKSRSAVIGGALGLVAALILSAGPWSLISGLAIGALAGSHRAASQRIAELEAAIRRLDARLARRDEAEDSRPAPESQPTAASSVAPRLPTMAEILEALHGVIQDAETPFKIQIGQHFAHE